MNVRRVLISAVLCAGLVLIACLGAGEALSRPASHPIGDPPPDLHAHSVRFSTAAGEPVAGWFIRGTERHGAVLLLHGIRSDRRAMVERARLLGGAGYSVLLIDLPAHGESGGARITFGLHEGAGVRAALGFLRGQLPGEPVGVIGVSLGAASLVLSKATPPPDAVVLESMYPTIAEAVTDRLTQRLGPAGQAIAPLLLWQLPLRLGITADELRPVDGMPSLHAPVLVMSGTVDQQTTLAESRRIFEAAAAPKDFWAVEGAAHVDLFTHAPQAYASLVLPFLARHLHPPTQPL
ncbi:MAG TPA: alpha/beta hydrolase [Burkholderiaceae bacterium]|nr:alpha/beta hydrolase [Burkholderiaceae bacterium]